VSCCPRNCIPPDAGIAQACGKPIINQGSDVVWGRSGADFKTGTLNPPQYNQWDIWWEQAGGPERQMTPVNGAIIVNLGVVDFNAITDVQLYSYPYSTIPIPGNDDNTNQLVNGDVLAVHTNGGGNAKVKVLE